MFFSTRTVTDASVTRNVRIGSNDKLHQALPLTKTSFPRTSVRILLHTNCWLPYPSSLHGRTTFSACARLNYIFTAVPARSQTPPRKQPGDDRRLVILPRRRLSNQSTKFHRRGYFLFIAVEEMEEGKERNRESGRRYIYTRTARARKDWKPQRETCCMRENQ